MPFNIVELDAQQGKDANPMRVLIVDANGDPLVVDEGDALGSEHNAVPIAYKDSDGNAVIPQGSVHGHPGVVLHDPDGDPIGHEAISPLYVTTAAPAAQQFKIVKATGSDLAASIVSTGTEPYNIGGTTLTIDINGTTQYAAFPTTAATEGIHYSAQNPALNNPDDHKLKVAIDGGLVTEVEITKNLGTPTAIASALQTQIRALVPNGTNAVVEYSPTDYPGRYVFRAGTTPGTSSTIRISKGGDDLDAVLKVGPDHGGTDRDGLAANYYYVDDAISEMNSDLTDVIVETANGDIKIRTVGLGSSYDLQVTAGGANTALAFPTTLTAGTDGTGSDDLSVNGSVTSQQYDISFVPGKIFYITKLTFRIRDDNAEVAKNFGGIADGLTNGLKVEIKSAGQDPVEWFTARTNADLISRTDDGTLWNDAFNAGGKDLCVARMNWLGNAIALLADSTEAFYFTVQDDLTPIDVFTIEAEGWVEDL